MSKRKNLLVGVITLSLVILLCGNVYAASDTIRISSNNLHPTGQHMYVGDNHIDAVHSLNQSNINFHSRVKRVDFGLDNQVYERLVGDQQEINSYDIYVTNDDDYYPEAEWSGESGAAYIKGSVTMTSK